MVISTENAALYTVDLGGGRAREGESKECGGKY